MRDTAAPTAVLFVLIGWGLRYDGTEQIEGGHKYLRNHPAKTAEGEAFVPQKDGKFRCGAGRGLMHEQTIDAVFVARNPDTREYHVVGVYPSARPRCDEDGSWTTLVSRQSTRFRRVDRVLLQSWPQGQGMRRWARRSQSRGRVYPELLTVYKALRRHPAIGQVRKDMVHDDVDIELSAFEGERRKQFVAHRHRESALRAAKIRASLREHNGHLVCEVLGCGFDFFKCYGGLGENYAQVHHLKPLASATAKGTETTLADLAIVCANCHVMVHRGGRCRPLNSLIPRHRR